MHRRGLEPRDRRLSKLLRFLDWTRLGDYRRPSPTSRGITSMSGFEPVVVVVVVPVVVPVVGPGVVVAAAVVVVGPRTAVFSERVAELSSK